MKGLGNIKAILIVVATVCAMLLISTTGFGQCSMCRTALAGSSNALFIRNFNIGVLVLLVPAVAIFCSIFVALKRVSSLESPVSSQSASLDRRLQTEDSRTKD